MNVTIFELGIGLVLIILFTVIVNLAIMKSIIEMPNKKKEEVANKFTSNAKKKLIENLLSVKVWVIVLILITSTILVVFNYLSGDAWATVNAGIVATVIGCREAFKVAKVRETHNKEMMP